MAMFLPEPRVLLPPVEEADDQWLESVPDRPAVFLLWAREGEPYLARTSVLRRRLRRLLGRRDRLSSFVSLRGVTERVEWWPTGSTLEASLLQYGLARRHFPSRYLQLLKLRMPAYVKLLLDNPFPRSQVTTKLSDSPALYYGPFRTRAAAEQFDVEMLGLFLLRRCVEDLSPSPEHPGCPYGEMGMCLRPCQQVVSEPQYRGEARRVAEFLASDGRSLLDPLAAERRQLSENMDFEQAARVHQRHAKVVSALRLRDEGSSDIATTSGVCITPGHEPGGVLLWPFIGGQWEAPRELEGSVRVDASEPLPARERQEHLALWARWFYSPWRDGEWVAAGSDGVVPARKLANAVRRVGGLQPVLSGQS